MRATTMCLAGLGLLFVFGAGCGPDESREDELAPIRKTRLPKGLGGPSGLAIVDDTLWVVNDEAPRAVELTPFAVEVSRITVDAVCGEDEGFEAIAWDGAALLVACEPTGEILRVAPDTGALLGRIPVEGLDDRDSGIEGLAVREDGHILAAREKNPSELVRLDAAGHEVERIRLRFSEDVSGLSEVCAPGCPGQLLVVSQEDRRVYQIDESGDPLAEWPVDAIRPEGIACDADSLYIIDEETRELLVFEFPGRCL